MSMKFNELKLCLIDYLIRVEKYKPSKISNDQASYLVNKRQKNQIVVVTIGEAPVDDQKVDQIKSEIKVGARERINVLKIAVTNDNYSHCVCVGDLKEAIFKLKEFYSKIENLKEPKNEEESVKYSDEEILDQFNNPENSTNKRLKELVGRMNNRTVVSMIFSAIFVVMPSISIVLFFYLQPRDSFLTDPAAAGLFFGGTTNALTIQGMQFWRIFTYGFNVFSQGGVMGGWIAGVIEIVIIALFGLKIARFTEGIFGSWKFAVTVLITYPLAGLFATALMPTAKFSGTMVFMVSVIAILGVTTWTKKKDAVQLYASSQVITSVFILVAVLLFFKPTTEYTIVTIAAGISGSIALLFTYDYSRIDIYLALPLIILGVIVVLPVFAMLYPKPNLAYDAVVAQSLLSSARHGIFSIDKANSVLNHDLGWRYFIVNNGTKWSIKGFVGG